MGPLIQGHRNNYYYVKIVFQNFPDFVTLLCENAQIHHYPSISGWLFSTNGSSFQTS